MDRHGHWPVPPGAHPPAPRGRLAHRRTTTGELKPRRKDGGSWPRPWQKIRQNPSHGCEPHFLVARLFLRGPARAGRPGLIKAPAGPTWPGGVEARRERDAGPQQCSCPGGWARARNGARGFGAQPAYRRAVIFSRCYSPQARRRAGPIDRGHGLRSTAENVARAMLCASRPVRAEVCPERKEDLM